MQFLPRQTNMAEKCSVFTVTGRRSSFLQQLKKRACVSLVGRLWRRESDTVETHFSACHTSLRANYPPDTQAESLWGSFEQTFWGARKQPWSCYWTICNLNISKTNCGLQKSSQQSDATNIKVKYVQPYKYLETIVDSRLNSDINCEALWKKCLHVCFT